MIIYPAIDIYEGRAVRLKRGDYQQMVVYNDNPVSVAKSFKNAGAKALHVVDLEGARKGKPINFDIIAQIAAETKLLIQAGGGIRTEQSIEMCLSKGICRVILGTSAVSQPGFLREMIVKYGDSIAVSADVKNKMIAMKGWTELSNQNIMTFCSSVEKIGVKNIICTDISKDGMQNGSNIELYRIILNKLSVNLIASGGVSSVTEIKELASLGVSGVILGKALYEGIVNLKDALLFSE